LTLQIYLQAEQAWGCIVNKDLKNAYIVHICKYLGIALVSGSIVHAGTLGGSNLKYMAFIAIGIALTVFGSYLEYAVKNIAVSAKLLLLTIALSFGTGMLSGGIQHFADNPAYGSMLLSLGAIITFLSMAYKDFPETFKLKLVAPAIAASAVMYFALPLLSYSFMNDHGEAGHHGDEAKTEVHEH
jgi:hypothetical protein